MTMLLGSCNKEYLETTPTDSVSNSVIFSNLEGMEMALQGTYRNFGQWRDDNGFTGMNTPDMYLRDMFAGTLARPNSSNGWYWSMYTFSGFDGNTDDEFYDNYRYLFIQIKNLNFIISDGAKIETLTDEDAARKAHIIAEAQIGRAWCYLVLGQYYGGRWPEAKDAKAVPVVTDPYAIESVPANTLGEVLAQAQADLSAAIPVLEASTYEIEVGKNVQISATQRFTKYAAYLLQSRLSMYTLDYATALTYAKKITESNGSDAGLKLDIMGPDAYTQGFNSVSNPEYIFSTFNGDTNPVYFGSFYAYMSSNFSSTFTRTGPNAISSDVLKLVPSTDSRLSLYLTDAQDVIDANKDTDGEYYYNQGFGPTASSLIITGVSKKFRTTTSGTLGGGDVPYMRAAEAYYLAAEAAVLSGDLAGGAAMLARAITPYDATYVAATTLDQFNADLYLYKSFDMYGEGATWADIKRRGDVVKRTNVSDGGNHSDDAIRFEYSVISHPELFQFPLPKTAKEHNTLL